MYVPTLAMYALLHEPFPDVREGAVHSSAPSPLNITMPVGVPLADSTVAE